MAVALVQEFKIVGSDRSTPNYDHIDQRLDIDSNPPEGRIARRAARPRIDVPAAQLRSWALSARAWG